MTKQYDDIVFDFLSHIKHVQSASGQVSILERNLLNILRQTLPARKIAYFKKNHGDHLDIGFQTGYEPSEIELLQRLLADENIGTEPNHIRLFDSGGLKNTYLLHTYVEASVHFIVVSVSSPLTDSKIDLAKMVLESLHLVVHEYDVSAHGIAGQFSELVLKNMASGIIVIDQDENIVYINRAAEMILGYGVDEVKHKHCDLVFREIDGEKNWLTFTLATGCMSSRKKIYMVRKDEIDIPVGGTTSLLRNDQGEIVGVIGLFREYEDFQKSEDRKKDLNKMSTLAKLSASIAHEIRNPLAGISATAQVLASKLEEGDRKKKFVMVILDEIERINRIIKELLNFASPSKISFFYSNINKIIESSLDLVHKKFQKQSIDVIRDYDRELPDMLCDENQIQQAIINIMLNAISVMPDGGVLTVTTELTELHNTEYISITIRDTGTGIPDEILKDLFEPFNSTKTNGLGLGLTITRSIVKTHKGKIEARNLPDQGAEVTVLLPAHLDQDDEKQMYFAFDEKQ